MEEELKKKDDDLKKLRARAFVGSCIAEVYIFIIMLLYGCSHKGYVPVESVCTDTIYMAHRDSVHIKG